MSREQCPAHKVDLAEGDICWKCEELGDALVAHVNAELGRTQYELMYVQGGELKRVPLTAEATFHGVRDICTNLRKGGATGTRIARFDETEGCEVILHEFK